MAITIWLGKTDKRRNSTLVPLSTIFTEEVSCVLKDSCSDYTPVFLLNHSNSWGGLNYIKWDDRYYFIDDVVYEANELFSVHCTMDLLASFKTEILANQAFVLYDSAGDTEIPDTRLSTKTSRGLSVVQDQFQSLGQVSIDNQIVVLGITSEDGVSYWAVTQAVASSLLTTINASVLDNLFQPVSGTTLEDILTEVGDNISTAFIKMFSAGTAPACITSAKQLPVGMGAVSGNTGAIMLGQFPTSKNGMEIARRAISDSVGFTIPWTFSDWRRRAPYTELYLFCPYFGMVSLPVDNLIGESVIGIECTLDLPTGQAIFEVFGQNNHYIGTYSANLGGEYAVGVSGVNATQMSTSVIGATAAGAAIMAMGGSAASMAAKIGGAALAGIIGGNTPTASTISGGGGGAALGVRPECYLIEITHDTTVAPSSVASVVGIPSMQVKTLSSIAGYVQTLNASISCNANASETQKINDMLNGGIYIE